MSIERFDRVLHQLDANKIKCSVLRVDGVELHFTHVPPLHFTHVSSTLAHVLQQLYASEINCSVSCFWDGGWELRLGDEMNGWRANRTFKNDELESQGVSWLIKNARAVWPQSEFARSHAHD
jgi:hypothetical protein